MVALSGEWCGRAEPGVVRLSALWLSVEGGSLTPLLVALFFEDVER